MRFFASYEAIASSHLKENGSLLQASSQRVSLTLGFLSTEEVESPEQELKVIARAVTATIESTFRKWFEDLNIGLLFPFRLAFVQLYNKMSLILWGQINVEAEPIYYEKDRIGLA